MERFVKIPLKAIGQEDIVDPDGEYEPTTHFIAEVVDRQPVDGKLTVEAVHTGDRFLVDPTDCEEHEGMWL